MKKFAIFNKIQRLIDSVLSCLLFAFLNLIGIYLVIESDIIKDSKHPIVTVICFIFIYSISAASFFGYRVREINSFVRLSTPFGKEKVFEIDEIYSLKSVFRFSYLLKSNTGSYFIWNHLGNVENLGIEIAKKKSGKAGLEDDGKRGPENGKTG